MKKLTTILGLALALGVAAPAFAAAQQDKMKTCNVEAKGKKGDERKAFMKECLSKDGAPAAKSAKATQQEKMKTCNTEAKGKKGDERKAFMKECLSK
ncbi:MAG: phosphate starvation-inducible protein PsiF [Betaproteobacteria bacterium]|nr:phosphate starvation-inducible protein PsiF [Betaproteobacteria bacterium]MDE2047298.1 phosphate starvation-inducible protein PsiF [Betaproteobacteria bacterium]